MGLSIAKISDEQLEVERAGIWRPILTTMHPETLECVEFLVRYWETAGGQEEFMKRLHRNQSLATGKSNEAQKYKVIAQKKALVQMCLAGWRTVQLERTGNDEDPYRRVSIINEKAIEFEVGQWVEYSDQAALRLTNLEWREVFSVLESAANDDQSYREYLESVAKNSPSSSDGRLKSSEVSSETIASD